MKLFYPDQKVEVEWHIPGGCTSCPKQDHPRKFSMLLFNLQHPDTGQQYLKCKTYSNPMLKSLLEKAAGCVIEAEALPDKFGNVKIDAKVGPQPFALTLPSSPPPLQTAKPRDDVSATEVANFLVDSTVYITNRLLSGLPEQLDLNKTVEAARALASGLLIECRRSGIVLKLEG